LELSQKWRLYVFSDGVYEVEKPDGTMWSFDELQDYLSSPPADPGAEIEGLYKALQELHSGETLDDDFSLLRLDFP
jgi:sigma-B regulation protein RsbU (phosphoserine phosphatase)